MGCEMVGATPNVWCDNCGKVTATIVAHPDGSVEQSPEKTREFLHAQGWITVEGEDDYCPDCVPSEEELHGSAT